jgi:RHS repeat-associated protein
MTTSPTDIRYTNAHDACKFQHEYYNPGADLGATIVSDGPNAECNWTLNENSNTILPAGVRAYCPEGWIHGDPNICVKYYEGGHPECDCEEGGTAIAAPPFPKIGNPVGLNYASKLETENDYSSADGRFTVDRFYNSLIQDFYQTRSPTAIAGFGGHWHGVIPGRLGVWGAWTDTVEYLSVKGGHAIFESDDYANPSAWGFKTNGNNRRRLSMVQTPQVDRATFFNAPAVLNGPAEMRMDMAQGEYILFRRAYPTRSSGVRYLIPIERGYADGYKIWYDYAGTDEFPTVVRDSLGRQIALTWVEAAFEPSVMVQYTLPVKVISQILLPDSTKLTYSYGFGKSPVGNVRKDRLEKVERLSAVGAVLWGRSYLYENATLPNALTGKVDQDGNRLSTYTYDAAGLVKSTELAGGVQRYQIQNKVDSQDDFTYRYVTNALGHRTDYTFRNYWLRPGTPQLLMNVKTYAAANIAPASVSYDYWGSGGDFAIAVRTNENGVTSNIDVDAKRRPTSIREGAGTADERTTAMTWHPTFDLPLEEIRPGISTTYSYSPTGLLLTRTETDTTTQTTPYATAGQARTWTYDWNGNGRLLSVNGPKGVDANSKDDTETFTYDTGGNLLTATNGLGHSTTFSSYDANGRPQLVTDASGAQTAFVYDALGRTTTITVKDPVSPANDAVTTLSYDIEGRVIGITAPATDQLFMDYDLAGQLMAVRGANGDKTMFTRDAMGNVTAQTVKRANGSTARAVTRTFDALGRMLTETLGPSRTTRWQYDKVGNSTQITSARSYATTQAFDPLNRLVTAVAPDDGSSQTAYDALDRTSSFTDAKSVTTNFVRNGFGDVIREVSPDRGTSTYYYDSAGDMTASIDGRGQRIDYVRDALGRIKTKTPTGRPASETISYTYDTAAIAGSFGVGRLATVADGTGTTSFKYDHRGNMLIKRQTIGSTASADLAYAYDVGDRISAITYPSGRIVNYVRDTKGRVSSVTTRANAAASAITLASGMTYEPFGSLLTATYGNGLALGQGWGNDGRLASRRLYRSSTAANLSQLTYGYDHDDNITSIADGVDPARNVTYFYDRPGRLARSVAVSGAVKRVDFFYDKNGNPTGVERRPEAAGSSPSTTTIYTLQSGTNRLASVSSAAGARTIGYDARGNTITETRPGSVAVTAGYDGHGRLISYAAGGSVTLANSYNGLDDRVTVASGADTRRYVFDGDGRMLGEYGASAADVKAETIWLSPEVSVPGQSFGGDDGVGGYAPLAVASGAGGTVLTWVHGNHLGVPIAATDGAGNAMTPSGYTVVGFPGQTQTLSDLYYNRYRDYDPTLGRYIQADPIGLAGGNNPYAYAANNPLRWIDPDGLQTIGGVGVPPGSCPLYYYLWLRGKQSRACAGEKIQTCVEGMTLEEMSVQIERRIECAQLRSKLNSECFAGGDVGHTIAVDQLWKGVARCQSVALREYRQCPIPRGK